MITLVIYFAIYLIIVFVPYAFVAEVAMSRFGIQFPQPSMEFLFLTFLFFPIILKLLKILSKIILATFAILLGAFISILNFPFKENSGKSNEELENKREIENSILE